MPKIYVIADRIIKVQYKNINPESELKRPIDEVSDFFSSTKSITTKASRDYKQRLLQKWQNQNTDQPEEAQTKGSSNQRTEKEEKSETNQKEVEVQKDVPSTHESLWTSEKPVPPSDAVKSQQFEEKARSPDDCLPKERTPIEEPSEETQSSLPESPQLCPDNEAQINKIHRASVIQRARPVPFPLQNLEVVPHKFDHDPTEQRLFGDHCELPEQDEPQDLSLKKCGEEEQCTVPSCPQRPLTPVEPPRREYIKEEPLDYRSEAGWFKGSSLPSFQKSFAKQCLERTKIGVFQCLRHNKELKVVCKVKLLEGGICQRMTRIVRERPLHFRGDIDSVRCGRDCLSEIFKNLSIRRNMPFPMQRYHRRHPSLPQSGSYPARMSETLNCNSVPNSPGFSGGIHNSSCYRVPPPPSKDPFKSCVSNFNTCPNSGGSLGGQGNSSSGSPPIRLQFNQFGFSDLFPNEPNADSSINVKPSEDPLSLPYPFDPLDFFAWDNMLDKTQPWDDDIFTYEPPPQKQLMRDKGSPQPQDGESGSVLYQTAGGDLQYNQLIDMNLYQDTVQFGKPHVTLDEGDAQCRDQPVDAVLLDPPSEKNRDVKMEDIKIEPILNEDRIETSIKLGQNLQHHCYRKELLPDLESKTIDIPSEFYKRDIETSSSPENFQKHEQYLNRQWSNDIDTIYSKQNGICVEDPQLLDSFYRKETSGSWQSVVKTENGLNYGRESLPSVSQPSLLQSPTETSYCRPSGLSPSSPPYGIVPVSAGSTLGPDMTVHSPNVPSPESQSSPKSSIPPKELSITQPLETRLAIIRQRLNLLPSQQLDLVNGGYGLKNPRIPPAGMFPKIPNPPLRSPTDPSMFLCPYSKCGKSFQNHRLLSRHIKCHTPQAYKRFICSYCIKGFDDTFDLKRHTRTHTGLRPYTCSACDKAFTQRCSLESHSKKVHGIAQKYKYKERRRKTYVCEYCIHQRFTTEDATEYAAHIRHLHPHTNEANKLFDKRHFKYEDGKVPSGLLKLHS